MIVNDFIDEILMVIIANIVGDDIAKRCVDGKVDGQVSVFER